jgi:hypothetical protein
LVLDEESKGVRVRTTKLLDMSMYVWGEEKNKYTK